MCRFSKRCKNFVYDSRNPKNCLLLCQKNPLALSISIMPDRFVEKDANNEEDSDRIIEQKRETPPQTKKTRNDILEKEYLEAVTALQESENELIEFEFSPETDIDDKQKIDDNSLLSLIKKVSGDKDNMVIDEDLTKIIEDNIEENTTDPNIHPLDVNINPVEMVGAVDQPEEPVNEKVYVKKRERGRPKMSDEEKEKARLIREERKRKEDIKKEGEAKKRRKENKKKIREMKKAKAKAKAKAKKKFGES